MKFIQFITGEEDEDGLETCDDIMKFAFRTIKYDN